MKVSYSIILNAKIHIFLKLKRIMLNYFLLLVEIWQFMWSAFKKAYSKFVSIALEPIWGEVVRGLVLRE